MSALPDTLFPFSTLFRSTAFLFVLPVLASTAPSLRLSNIFYRAGSLVFGGGHVVLPLLRAGLVPAWMGDSAFLAGYGAAQAVPGPLFTLSAYLGAIATPQRSITGATRSEEHTSELQSIMRISYADFCLKKKKNTKTV